MRAAQGVLAAFALLACVVPASAVASNVSCTSKHACVAVETSLDDYGDPAQVNVERWNGASWTSQAPPGFALGAVSCTASNACTAVGDGVIRWNGSSWSTQPSRARPFGWKLSDVSCASAMACLSVGYIPCNNYGCSSRAVSQRWDGSRWYGKVLGSRFGSWGVSCVTANACTAVGGDVAERWNGSRWSDPATISLRGLVLESVSCTAYKACAAVGYNDVSRASLLAARWNGSSWSTMQLAPRFSNQEGQAPIVDVSCTSSRACMAVASGQEGPDKNLYDASAAERWNGYRWSTEPIAKPSGAVNVDLNGVSCISRTHCVAVGTFTKVHGCTSLDTLSLCTPTFLAESWNGTRWSIQTS